MPLMFLRVFLQLLFNIQVELSKSATGQITELVYAVGLNPKLML